MGDCGNRETILGAEKYSRHAICNACAGKRGAGVASASAGAAGLEYARRSWRQSLSVDSPTLEGTAHYFLTVRGDSAEIVCGFQNGADDYVVKPFTLEVLYARILALLRRTKTAAGQYLSCDGIVIDQKRCTVTYACEEIHLSAAEYHLLLYLMQNKGQTVTRERILEQLWDMNGSYVNDNTLTVTMKRLRDKLSQPACIKTVRSVGYRMEDTL